jgi:hypothetical protein
VPCADSSPLSRPRLAPKAKIPNHEGTRLRFARDSPLEGGGFEPSVPLLRMAPRPASAELWEVPRRHE